ncbi:MAG: nicotinamide N-methylase [Frankiales bacterium]|nr:nicotinamide N-methylase [Frankiales bacterium]
MQGAGEGGTPPDDRARRLVLTRTRLQRPPAVPELLLHLADGMEALWEDVQRELDTGDLPPPFWAFAWLGGQALARYVIDRPQEVRELSVLDLATGSGLVALAAARAGAASVRAVDVDPLCRVAVDLNAEANGLRVDFEQADLLDAAPPEVDVLLAGDVFYDAEMSARVLPWLQAAHAQGTRVLLGDPVRHYLPQTGLVVLAEHDVPTTRDLEGVELKRVRILTFG